MHNKVWEDSFYSSIYKCNYLRYNKAIKNSVPVAFEGCIIRYKFGEQRKCEGRLI